MKNKFTSSVILTAVALLCGASMLAQSGQKKEPAAQQKKQKAPPLPGAGTGGTTPHATISATIGPNRNAGGMIMITYGRPHAVHPRKGGEPRKIWGGLVPYGKADRLGADEATTFVNEYPVEIGGETLPSGAYTLYIVPSETGASKLAFSKHVAKWGVPVDESQDVVRVDLKKEMLDENVPQLTIEVENSPPRSMD
ncbi:MAG: DUF2911 domain-containing protein, partial [Opitutaceae bacterium]